MDPDQKMDMGAYHSDLENLGTLLRGHAAQKPTEELCKTDVD
jgi:hypothetical protein